MTLQDIIGGFRHPRRVIQRPRRRRNLRLAQVAQTIAETMSEVGSMPTTDRDAVVRRFRQAVGQDAVADLSDREIGQAADCIHHGEAPIVREPLAFGKLLIEVGRRENRRACRALIKQYFFHFDANERATTDIGRFLADAVIAWDLRPWNERHRRCRLFEPEQVGQRLLDDVTSGRSVRRTMNTAGIGGIAFAAGIGIHTFRLACDWIRERLECDPKLDDVELIIGWGAPNDDRLLYESVRSDLADALLLPWGDPQRSVPDDVKRRLEDFFDAAYGDPRLRNRQNHTEQRNLWVGVSEGALQVRMRWLAREALEHFLKVVDATAEQQQQWEYRRAFWGAYIDRNHVHDAWVAFGNRGRQYARQLARDLDDDSLTKYAALNRPYEGSQAVLLLKIGNLIVVDWSHNGRVRIWHDTDDTAPGFREEEYDAHNLRLPCAFERPHLPPTGWQQPVHDFIRRHTRISIPHRDYMP